MTTTTRAVFQDVYLFCRIVCAVASIYYLTFITIHMRTGTVLHVSCSLAIHLIDIAIVYDAYR